MEDLFAMDANSLNNNIDLRCAEKPVICNEQQFQPHTAFIPANIPDLRSTEDPVLINDTRVLTNILARQAIGPRCTSKLSSVKYQQNYFENGIQLEIKSHMRKMVSDWMLEVCEEQRCQPEVFHLAINYMDRFLSEVRIKKSQFQLLACVCLFLASKFKETCPLPAENLVLYTECSVTIQEITQWELMVLGVLKWDLSSVTPYSVLDNILRRYYGLSETDKSNALQLSTVRRHAETFVALASTESNFMRYSSAVVAVSSLGAAIRGLHVGCYGKDTVETFDELNTILEHLQSTTGTEKDEIRECMDQIEVSIRLSMSGISFQPSSAESTAPRTEEAVMSSRQGTSENHQTSSCTGLSHQSNSSTPKIIVVQTGNGGVPNHSGVASKASYISSASTTPTDLMDVVTSAACMGVC